MIQKIHLKNYKKHEDFSLKLSPHITTITGKTDSGKSTILKAIRLVVFNKPSGNKFIRDGAAKASVTLWVDGRKIIRTRSRSQNSYKIDKKTLKAFRVDPPSEVSHIINLSELNFQAQHDSPFWFRNTAGEVSRQLNAIVDLDIIDKSLSIASSKVSKVSKETEYIKDRIKELSPKKKQMSFSLEADKELSKIEHIQDKINKITNRAQYLKELLGGVLRYRKRIINTLEVKRDWCFISELEEKLRNGHKRQVRLYHLIENLKKNLKTVNNSPPSLDPLKQEADHLEEIRKKETKLKWLVDNIIELRDKKSKTEQDIKKCQKRIKEIIGKTCPMCGTPQIK